MTNKYYLKYGVGYDCNLINFKILLLYSILKNDKKMINFYLNFLTQTEQKNILIINDYFKIKENEKDINKIKKKLQENYSEKDINHIFKIFDTLSLDVIGILLLQKKETSQNFYTNETKKIVEKLIEVYKNNIPNQNNLKDVI